MPARAQTRHYCSRCGARVYPFDKYEHLTEATRLGRSRKRVLMSTWNNAFPYDREAYCFARCCRMMVRCARLGETEWLKLYIARKGVVQRPGPLLSRRKRKKKAAP